MKSSDREAILKSLNLALKGFEKHHEEISKLISKGNRDKADKLTHKKQMADGICYYLCEQHSEEQYHIFKNFLTTDLCDTIIEELSLYKPIYQDEYDEECYQFIVSIPTPMLADKAYLETFEKRIEFLKVSIEKVTSYIFE